MLKFLRRYDKLILAIGGSLLMVVFLLPRALQRLGADQSNRAVVMIDGQKITMKQASEAAMELSQLNSMNPDVPQRLLRMPEIDVDHWMMLTHAAQAGGFIGGPYDGRGFNDIAANYLSRLHLLQQARLYGARPTPEDLQTHYQQLQAQFEAVRQSSIGVNGRTEKNVDITLAKARGVYRMFEAYANSVKLSAPEAIRDTRNSFDQVVIDYAMLKTDPLPHEMPQPSDEAIQRQYEKFRDVRPGEGEHGFGYLREPAAQAEWLQISRQKLLDLITPDDVEVRIRWQQNRDQYPGEFSEVRSTIEDQLRDQDVNKAMQSAIQFIQAEVIKATQSLQKDGRFKVLPPDWRSRQENYNDVAATVNKRLAEREGVIGNPVEVGNTTGWMGRSVLGPVTAIGSSYLRVGRNSIPFTDLVMSVRELDPESPYGAQVGVTTGPLVSPKGDVFFFRVVKVRPETPPENEAEIRSNIIHDLQRLEAFEEFQTNKDELREEAVMDFDTVADRFKGVTRMDVKVRRSGMIANDGQPVRTDINNKAVRDAISDYAHTLDPTVVAEPDPLKRIMLIPLPDSLAALLVRITSLQPISLQVFRRLEPRMTATPDQMGNPNTDQWPFTKERLAARYGYENLRRSTRNGADDDAMDDADERAGAASDADNS